VPHHLSAAPLHHHSAVSSGRAAARPLLVPPTHVVGRRSTDTLAIDDPILAAALRFIRDRAAEPITVPDVLDAVAVSRRSLERRFHAALDRSPAAEIRQAHLRRAQELLAATDLPLPAVAAASGFGSPEYLATVFKHETGQTPLKYRSRVRAR
jgi:LacI family transcriptional regulator